MDEEQAKAAIERCYQQPDFCLLEDADTQLFTARYAAIRCPKRWWNSGPAYHIHEVRADGGLGKCIAVVSFVEEARHVAR